MILCTWSSTASSPGPKVPPTSNSKTNTEPNKGRQQAVGIIALFDYARPSISVISSFRARSSHIFIITLLVRSSKINAECRESLSRPVRIGHHVSLSSLQRRDRGDLSNTNIPHDLADNMVGHT